MGTSQSSPGPPSNVPLVPPWVPDPPVEDDNENETSPEQQQQDPQSPRPLAPTGRFGPARRSLGDYGRTGSRDSLRRGLGHYVRRGLGGTGAAVQRSGGTARTAGTLYNALSASATGESPTIGSPFDPLVLTNQSAEVIMDAVVEAVRPIDGTLDADASRRAIRSALSELLDRFPDADLLNLSQEERSFVIETFVAIDVFNRFHLDVGKSIQDKAPTATTALGHLREARDFIKESVAAAFRKLRVTGQSLSAGRVGRIVSDALRETFEVFEGYLQ